MFSVFSVCVGAAARNTENAFGTAEKPLEHSIEMQGDNIWSPSNGIKKMQHVIKAIEFVCRATRSDTYSCMGRIH